jgi:hypothetical protein
LKFSFVEFKSSAMEGTSSSGTKRPCLTHME